MRIVRRANYQPRGKRAQCQRQPHRLGQRRGAQTDGQHHQQKQLFILDRAMRASARGTRYTARNPMGARISAALPSA